MNKLFLRNTGLAFLALLMTSCLAGCGNSNSDAAVELSEDDPYLVESEEVLNYVPEDTSESFVP